MDELYEKINYSLCCLSKSYEGCGVHNRTAFSGLSKFSDLSKKIDKRVTDSLFALESIILLRMMFCVLSIVKITVDIEKLLRDVNILSILI